MDIRRRRDSLIHRVLFRAALTGVALISFGYSSHASAECLSLKEGPIVFDAVGCKKLAPEEFFDYSRDKYSWIKDLDPAGKKKLLDSYRGMLLKGQIVKSQVRDKGLPAAKGVLEGEQVFMYMPPSANTCQNVVGLRLAGKLNEKCCDGGGDG